MHVPNLIRTWEMKRFVFFPSTSIRAIGKCGPASFTCVPTRSTRLTFFFVEKFVKKSVLEKSELPLILFYFKMENKIRNKTLKKWLHNFWKNMSLKNLSLGPGIRLPIGKVPLKGSTLLSPKKVSSD